MKDRVQLPLVIDEAFRNMSGNLRVCLPAVIQTYDPDTMLATVQPSLKRQFYGAPGPLPLPIIANVPVVHPRCGAAMIRLPVRNGDLVMLVFSDRSLEEWAQGKGEARYPEDPRQHHLSDAYAIPGGYPKGLARKAANPDALEIVLEPGTKITVGNGTDELLAIAADAFGALHDLCERLASTLTGIQALTVTCASPGSPSSVPINVATFSALKSEVDSITADAATAINQLGNIKA